MHYIEILSRRFAKVALIRRRRLPPVRVYNGLELAFLLLKVFELSQVFEELLALLMTARLAIDSLRRLILFITVDLRVFGVRLLVRVLDHRELLPTASTCKQRLNREVFLCCRLFNARVNLLNLLNLSIGLGNWLSHLMATLRGNRCND